VGRSESGGYPGSIGQALSRAERLAFRRALTKAKEPLHLSAIAAKAGGRSDQPAPPTEHARVFGDVPVRDDQESQDAFWDQGTRRSGREMVEKGLA
jgi:hypothetical protein